MKKMLLPSIAALLLATATAHADKEKWEASFRQCHISKWFSKDELAAIGWARETEGPTIGIEAEEGRFTCVVGLVAIDAGANENAIVGERGRGAEA